MSQTVRTTIVLQEDILKAVRLTAIREKKGLSAYIQEILEQKLKPQIAFKVNNPMELLGVLKKGKKKIYNSRADLYEEHTKRKMGI